jgi:DNA-binding NarL/FixJ family response regulator
MTIRILLADDHVIFRQGLSHLLREQTDWEVVGEVADGAEAVRLAQALAPEVAVLDLEMPGMDGIEAAGRIVQVSPSTRVVALSMYGDDYHQQRMMEAGASAYVIKNEAVDDLVNAIQAALRGERFVSSVPMRSHPSTVPLRPEFASVSLSDRELEVLRMMVDGQRARAIAENLGISARTVETYRGRIMLKLGIDNLPALVKFAIRAGITSMNH